MENNKKSGFISYLNEDILAEKTVDKSKKICDTVDAEKNTEEEITIVRYKASSFSGIITKFAKFNKTRKTLKRRFSSIRRKTKNEGSTEINTTNLLDDNIAEPVASATVAEALNIDTENNKNVTDFYQDEISLSYEPLEAQNYSNIIDPPKEDPVNKNYELVRNNDGDLYLQETCCSENDDAYEFMSSYLNKYRIYKINNLMIGLSSNVTYQGYYTPKNMSLELKKIKKSRQTDANTIDIYASVENLFHQIEIYKMIDTIGDMKDQNINIERHKHYIRGIHLSFNILNKIQFSLIKNDKDGTASHCINIDIEDKNADEISCILKNICYQEQSTNYKNYLSFIINFQSSYIKKLKKNIFFFTDENIYSLLSTNIKIYNNYYYAIKNMKFSLYAFDSYSAKNHEIKKLNCCCYYADYYIIALDILTKDKQKTKFFKVQGSNTMSESFNLFESDYVKELIQNNSQNEGDKFLVLISLLFPYYTDFNRRLEINDTQELSIEVNDDISKNTATNENYIAQQEKVGTEQIDYQEKEFSFLFDDTCSIVEIDDLPAEVNNIDILEVTTPTLLIFNILSN